MTVKQISVFLENKPGKLAEFTDVLSDNKIDMRALSLAEAADFGIARVIVDDVYNASTILKDAGYVFSMTKVVAAVIPDEPGGLSHVIKTLGDSGVNIEYMYAFANGTDASAVLKTDDPARVVDILRGSGFDVWEAAEAYVSNVSL